MTRLLLVRHGKPTASWNEDPDPGLDAAGREQAVAMASALRTRRSIDLVSSPLRRARDTARALEDVWDTTARVEPAVGEIPSPTYDLEGRGEWLGHVLRLSWSDLDDGLRAWRAALLDALMSTTADTAVCTHFVAINAVVGDATGDDRVVSCAPDYCSVTELEVVDGRLALVAPGREAATTVR